MKNIYLNDYPVRVDEDDFICLTDIWKATGSVHGNEPSRFLELKRTKSFVFETKEDACFEGTQNTISWFVKVIKGNDQSTFAYDLIAQKYAAWIDAKFEFIIHKAFRDLIKSPQYQYMAKLQDATRRLVKQEHTGSFHGHGLNEHKKRKNELVEEVEKVLNETQLKIDLKPLHDTD